MNTYTYALPRTESVWLLSSVTLLVSAAFVDMFAARVARVLSQLDLTLHQQGFPALLLISLSGGYIVSVIGHYAFRLSLSKTQTREVRHG
jgi:hypothetical protein